MDGLRDFTDGAEDYFLNVLEVFAQTPLADRFTSALEA